MTQNSGRENANPTLEQDVAFLRDVIRELTALQQDDDLLERYRGFAHLTKQSLERALGACSVSLWCQDDDPDYLVECLPMIISSPAASASHREPCRLPLDNPAQRRLLETGNTYLAFESHLNVPMTDPLSGSLACLAGFLLERPHGRPVLVNVDRIHNGDRAIHPSAFYQAVELIRLMWSQLQAANQRQWDKDHDAASRALRDDVFLARADEWAKQARKNDELFAVAALVLHGFRGVFAGQSHQWRQLSATVSRIIAETLKQRGRTFLLGRMADDVFALYLAHSDGFIAQSTTQLLTQALTTILPQEAKRQHWDLPGLELRWGQTDIKDYRGDMVDLLNRHYRRMFTRSANTPDNVFHIDFMNELQEAAHAGTNQS